MRRVVCPRDRTDQSRELEPKTLGGRQGSVKPLAS
jgi:hypothetical protein